MRPQTKHRIFYQSSIKPARLASSSRAIESKLQIEQSKLQRFPMGSFINRALSQPRKHRAIEQLSNRIEARAIEQSKLQRFPMGPPARCKPVADLSPTWRQALAASHLLYHQKSNVSLENCVNGFAAASWKFQTINISLEKYANRFTTAAWRFQTNHSGFKAASWRFQNC